MRFPQVYEIATTTVKSVDIDSTIANAIEVMINQEHRKLVVIDGDKYRIITVMDVIKLQNNHYDLGVKLSKLDLLAIPQIEANTNVLDTLEYLGNESEFISVINEDKSLYGIISHSDIISNIDPDTLMDNYRLQDFLKLGRRMKWVSPDTLTSRVLNDMVENCFDNVVVVENLIPVGILTTKDIMKLIKLKLNLEVSIKTYMSSPVEGINKTASIKDALAFLKNKHFKRVVVVDENNHLVGIITQKELISLTYSRWSTLMKEYQVELSEINAILEKKNKKYEVMASTDPLTGLYNRRKFTELYLSTYKLILQREDMMCLVILDMDHFKAVNDTYGHNTGDNVLVQVAHTILRTLRSTDIVCRWGGEEFVVLLPTVDLTHAQELSEKIRQNIELLEIDEVGHISASFGVAEVSLDDSMESAVAKADKALYLAKQSGRNCVKNQNDFL